MNFTEFEFDIFTKVNNIQKQIEECFNPAMFILNKQYTELQHELTELQNKCTHRFDENGVCYICGKRREE